MTLCLWILMKKIYSFIIQYTWRKFWKILLETKIFTGLELLVIFLNFFEGYKLKYSALAIFIDDINFLTILANFIYFSFTLPIIPWNIICWWKLEIFCMVMLRFFSLKIYQWTHSDKTFTWKFKSHEGTYTCTLSNIS